MDAESRRKQILNTITNSTALVSASVLAKELNVSRQVIVGDVALLRAEGHEIIATARGYMIPMFKELGQYIGKIACKHTADDSMQELYTIIDAGSTVINIIVEHEIYGEITGNLNLSSRADIDAFIDRVKNSNNKLLSELTSGIHLHTIACKDKGHFDQIYTELKNKNFVL